MKWLVYCSGVFVSAALLTALHWSGLYPSSSPAGAAIVTMLIFYFGVYFFPRLIIRRAEAKRASIPSCDVPVESAPQTQDIPQQISSDCDAPVERKLRPLRRDVVGYQFAVGILCVMLVIAALNYFSASAEVDELRIELETVRHDRYEEGYLSGSSEGYKVGYEVALAELDTYSCFSDGYLAGAKSQDAEGLINWSSLESSYLLWIDSLFVD